MIKKLIRIIILLLIIFPLKINAAMIESSIIPIQEPFNIRESIIEIIDFSLYKKESNIFGVSGTIKNHSNEDITYHLLVNYYNYNHEIVYNQISSSEITKDSYKNIYISNNATDIDTNLDTNQIAYYSIEVSSTNGTNKKNNYVISKHNVDIKVKNTNIYEVTEEVTVNYLEDNQQYIKYIPINNKDDLYKKIRVSNIIVDSSYDLKIEKDKYVLKIDGKNEKSEEKTYKITYKYIYGKDNNEELDKLYFSLNGLSDVPTNHFTFNIELPYKTKFDDLKVYSDQVSAVLGSNVTYTTNDNTISGKYNKTINNDEQIIIELDLTNNYFNNAKESNLLNISIMIIVPTISVLVLFTLWIIYGKDEKFTKSKQKNPPATLNSLDVGFLYKGKVNEMDISSLILTFANKGYLKIEEDKSDFGLIKSFELHKVKDYDGKNNKERIIFENLFKSKDIVTAEEIDTYFYNAANMVQNDLNHPDNKNKIFENTSMQAIIGTILAAITVFVIVLIPSIEYGTLESALLTIFLISIYAMIYTALYSYAKDKLTKIIVLILIIIHAVIYLSSTTLLVTLLNELSFLLAFIYGIACISLLILLMKIMPKRTTYGNKMLGKIVSYKNYLTSITKDEIETRVKENPNYFYETLPYAFVLGISNEWIRKFENIRMSKPKWTNDKTFHYGEFTTFITHSIHTLNKNIKNNK